MRPLRTLFVLLPILCGCGSAQLVLKSPVEDQCGKAGLKGCPELTDGVLFYVDGDKVKGKDHLLKGAAQNAPAKVRQFAKALKQLPLDKIPGGNKYTKLVLEVIDILAGASGGGGVDGGPGGTQDENGTHGANDAPAGGAVTWMTAGPSDRWVMR
jgi:hypothetical protein